MVIITYINQYLLDFNTMPYIREILDLQSQAEMDQAKVTDVLETIQANADMTEAMQNLEVSYATSALATASSLIGRVIEDGSVGDNGEANSYVVSKVENKDGSLYLTTNLITGVEDAIKDTETNKVLKYDSTGLIYDANGEATDVRVSLNSEGRFNYNDDGSLMLLDSDGNVITDEDITSKYVYAGSATIYADKTTTIPMNAITKVE